jgi:predicted transcriptional regulator
MVRIIELLRDGPRERAEIADALQLGEPATAAVLTAMQHRQIVTKEGRRYSLSPGTAPQDRTADTLSAKIAGLIDAAREAHHDDETIADALEEAAAALREWLT